jgi:hypothetical protein
VTTTPTAARPSFCDGIDASLGGCAPDRPAYAGATCEAVGHEFGRQLNARLVRIYVGPDVVNGETKAVRVGSVTSVSLSLANLHLRRVGIIAECGADEFIDAAEFEFTAALKADAGKYLADGPAVSYEEWLADLRTFASIIDAEESAPVPSF